MNAIRSLFIRMCVWWIERDIQYIQHQRELLLDHLTEARHQRMAWLAELDDIYMDRPA